MEKKEDSRDRRDPLDVSAAPVTKVKRGTLVAPRPLLSRKEEKDRFVVLCHSLWFDVLPNVRGVTTERGCWTIIDDARMVDTFWLLRGLVAKEMTSAEYDAAQNALYTACFAGSVAMTKFFVGELYLIPTSLVITPATVSSALQIALRSACRSGNVELIKWLEAYFKADAASLSALYESVFGDVCEGGHLHMAKRILSLDTDFIPECHIVQYAARSGSVEMMEWFLTNFPLVDVFGAFDSAVCANDSDVVKYLVTSRGDYVLDFLYSPHERDMRVFAYGIYKAVAHGNRELAKWIADLVPAPICFTDTERASLVYAAAYRGDSELFEWVFRTFSVDLSWPEFTTQCFEDVCGIAAAAPDTSLLQQIALLYPNRMRVIAEPLFERCCKANPKRGAAMDLLRATFGVRLSLHAFYGMSYGVSDWNRMSQLVGFVSTSPCAIAGCRCSNKFWKFMVFGTIPPEIFESFKTVLRSLDKVITRDYVVCSILFYACRSNNQNAIDWLVREYSVSPNEIRRVAMGVIQKNSGDEKKRRSGIKYLLQKAGVTNPWDVLDEFRKEGNPKTLKPV